MHPALKKYALAEVPRYTSYPTAAQFQTDLPESVTRAWLAETEPDQALSLYIHIPFCRQLCWYCGCHTTIPNSAGRVTDYLETLQREIALRAAALGAQGGVSHLHFGGGTPTFLTTDQFERLMAEIQRHFLLRPDAEAAIEIDPRGLTREMARCLRAAGINRASLGVQDFDAEVQAGINRIQPHDQVARAVEDLRAVGIEKISMDLMYGLPGQTEASVARSARLAAALEPDRLSVFGYAHVPWFKKHQRMIAAERLPGVEARFAQMEAIAGVLCAEGYSPIGFDHFARPSDSLARAQATGRLRRNFQGYTDDPAEILIGLGASAISALPGGYLQNETNLGAYAAALGNGRLPTLRGLALTGEDRLRRAAIERIMCRFALDTDDLAARLGHRAETLDGSLARAEGLARDGLVEIAGRRLNVTAQGRPFVRSVAACFDAYYRGAAGRHSKAV